MSDWDLEIRPHLTPYFAYGAAVLILAAHVAVGALLKIRSTGVIFQTADQVAIALARCRHRRCGPAVRPAAATCRRPGVAVRNLLTTG